MKSLPNNPNLDHLKRQAKTLLADLRSGKPEAVQRFQTSLPAAVGKDAERLAGLRLHDAQSCIAREYGFVSWGDLSTFVDRARARLSDEVTVATKFAHLAYAGGITKGLDKPQPAQAAQILSLLKEFGPLDPWIACAAGEATIVREAIDRDTTWISRSGGPLTLPPLVAAAHSRLVHLPEHKPGIHATIRLLLDAGADPNQSVLGRWPPEADGSPSQHRLSALYGAAGVNHDPLLTRMLLDAGANPNDNESLYHSIEAGDPELVQLLLDAGAIVQGTNALYHALDYDDLDTFMLLLTHTKTVDEPSMGPLLHWAIKRRRSVGHVQAILDAGGTTDGASALAHRCGLVDVAALLGSTAQELQGDADRFVAACARADGDEARRLKKRHPRFPAALDETQLKILPELAASGCHDAVTLMVELGWPLDIRGGEWSASALNQAVFRGDARLASTLLEHGSTWTEDHGFGDNACGTLSWASINRPEPDGDWVGCARALVANGMPAATRDPTNPEIVLVGGERRQFSEEVTQYLLSVGFT